MDAERMRILEMVSAGTITAAQAADLIAALEDDGTEAPALAADTDEGPSRFDPEEADKSDQRNRRNQPDQRSQLTASFPEPPLGFKKWSAFWLFPLTAGVIITVVFGLLLSTGIRAEWNGFWMFFCIWIPLFFGILVMLMGWSSRTARWLHVRVNTGQDEWPRRVAISLPLPLRTSAWVIRYFGHYIPGLDDIPVPLHEAILALQESLTPDEPLYVKVDERDGEQVEVYIG